MCLELGHGLPPIPGEASELKAHWRGHTRAWSRRGLSWHPLWVPRQGAQREGGRPARPTSPTSPQRPPRLTRPPARCVSP